MSTLSLVKLSIYIRSINNKTQYVIRATGGTVNTPLLSYLINYVDNNFESLRKNYLTLELLLSSSVHEPKLFKSLLYLSDNLLVRRSLANITVYGFASKVKKKYLISIIDKLSAEHFFYCAVIWGVKDQLKQNVHFIQTL